VREMLPTTVTLIAATVAAVASLLNVAVNVYFVRRSTREAQYRDLLKPYVVQLGEELHQVVACCKVAAKRFDKGEAPKPWVDRAHAACKRLATIQRQVKYPLGEVVGGVRELTRLANWVDHIKADRDRRDQMLMAAEVLRATLDEAVRDAYLSGTAPSRRAQLQVRRAAERLRLLWDRELPAEEANYVGSSES
jgi:hypothetical protein